MLDPTNEQLDHLANTMAMVICDKDGDNPEDTVFLTLTKNDMAILAMGCTMLQMFPPTRLINEHIQNLARKAQDAILAQKGRDA